MASPTGGPIPTRGPHWLALQFAEPYALDEVVLANRRQGIRADILDVWGLVNDEWTHLYRGIDLSKSAVVHARWPQTTVAGLRVEIVGSTLDGQRSTQAEIDELYFPGIASSSAPSASGPRSPRSPS